jgi:hypothetical protein
MRISLLAILFFLTWGANAASTQEVPEPKDVPLGDIARAARKAVTLPVRAIIDNDNLSQVMDDAQSRKLKGDAFLFSLDQGGKGFTVSSPDVTCNLSFSASATALVLDPVKPRELPQEELAKLEGPAALGPDGFQVVLSNGSSWRLQEITVGLTIVKVPELKAGAFGSVRLIPASSQSDGLARGSDVTLLLPLKGSADPAASAIFRVPLNLTIASDQEWHWAIVQAKGVPQNQEK